MSGIQMFEEQHIAATDLLNSTNRHPNGTEFESDANNAKSSDDGRHVMVAFPPTPVSWPTDAGFNLPSSLNPLGPPPPANFDTTVAEFFSFAPFAGDVHYSNTTYMPDSGGILDPALYLDLPPLTSFDQSVATSFQSSLPNQSPASPTTGFATSGLQDVSNKNSINSAANGCDTRSTLKDKRSIGSIVRAECRRLCGAIEYPTFIMRQNSRPVRRTKYTLPDPDAMPRRDSSGMLLHNPQWKKPTTNSVNELFIDAVVDAVQLVQAESTVGCERGAIRKVAKTYFRQLSITYADQTA